MKRGKSTSQGKPGHDLDGVSATDADRAGAQASGHGGMGIGADHQLARKGIVLQRYLVDDAGAWPPEAYAVLGRSGAQKVVHLAVLRQRLPEVRRALDPRLDQVVAVDTRRHSGLGPPRLHELEHRGLAQDVLENHPIWPELHVALAALQVGVGGSSRCARRTFSANPIGLPKRWRTALRVRSMRSYTLATNSGVDSIVIMSWFPSERERQLKHSPAQASYARALCLRNLYHHAGRKAGCQLCL